MTHLSWERKNPMVSDISMVFSVDSFRPGKKLIDIYIYVYIYIYASPKINMSATRGPTVSTRHFIFQPLIFMRYLLHPARLTWNLKIPHLERKMIFQTSMIMFHVNLQGVVCGCFALTAWRFFSAPGSGCFQTLPCLWLRFLFWKFLFRWKGHGFLEMCYTLED